MSEYRVEQRYPAPIEDVWHVLTDPEWVAAWTTAGRGGRPEGFAPEVGRRFRFVGRPTIGWDGVVRCEVLEARVPELLRYTWRGAEDGDATEVACRLEPAAGGTRLVWTHTGFRGVGGFAMSRLLGRVRRRMLVDGFPAALARYRATPAEA